MRTRLTNPRKLWVVWTWNHEAAAGGGVSSGRGRWGVGEEEFCITGGGEGGQQSELLSHGCKRVCCKEEEEEMEEKEKVEGRRRSWRGYRRSRMRSRRVGDDPLCDDSVVNQVGAWTHCCHQSPFLVRRSSIPHPTPPPPPRRPRPVIPPAAVSSMTASSAQQPPPPVIHRPAS